jgi:hypothetical protein
MNQLSTHEAGAVFAALNPGFKPDSRGRYRGPASYRGGDNPSALSVDVARGVWFDHVAGKGGDEIDFVRKALNTNFRGACRAIESIIGRPFTNPPKHVQRVSQAALADAEMFRLGFRWAIERHLDALKELWCMDETAGTTSSIRDATRLLGAVQRWTAWDAACFMRRYRSRRFIQACIAEAKEAQAQLVRAIVPDAPATAA